MNRNRKRPSPCGNRSQTGRRPAAAFAVVVALLATAMANPAHAERPRVYAITGAAVITAPGTMMESATVVVRDGLIEAVGTDVRPPADAEVIDGEGLTVHAGWIDPYSHLAMEPQQGGGGGGFNLAALFQPTEPVPGTGHPIELVHPQYRVTSELVADDSEVERRREQGFTAALVVPRSGIFRGAGALIALRDGQPRDLVIKQDASQHLAYDSGSFFGSYPSDLLGTFATIRQVHHDLMRYQEWTVRYAADPTGMPRPEYNDAMDALMRALEVGMPFFAEANDPRMVERTLEIADEFDVALIVKGSGYEYEMIDRLRGTALQFVIPVDFPDEPDVSSTERLPYVSLQSLQRWDKAPGNAAAMEAEGITFALTAYGMGNAGKFTENVRKAIGAGLSEDTALAAVTTVPAAMLGVAGSMGTVESGKVANLVVATGAPFGEDTELRHVFVDGHHYEMEEKEQVGDPDAVVDPRGEWAVTATVMGNEQNATWTIEGSEGNYTGQSVGEQRTTEFESITLEGNAMTIVIPGPMGTLEVTVVIEGEEFEGSASIDAPGGQTFTISFKGERTSGPQGGGR